MTSDSSRVEIPAITLRAFVEKWNAEWEGAYIQSLRGVGEETFVLKIRTKEKNVELLVQLPDLIAETTKKWPVLDEQPSIVNASKGVLDNAQIAHVRQHGMDRILEIECKSCTIVLELFGDGNILVLDAQKKIVFVHHAREWKGRVLKKNHEYHFPNGPIEWSAWPAHKKDLPDLKPFRNVGGWMVSTLGIPPAWVAEWCARIERMPADENPVNEGEWKVLRAHAKKILAEVNEKMRVRMHENVLLPALETKSEEKMELSVAFARIEEDVVSEKKHVVKDTKRESELAALRVNLARQEAQVKAWEKKAEDAHTNGEWIYTHYADVEAVLTALTRAKKQKLDSKLVEKELQKRYPQIGRIDHAQDEVEWDEK